MAKKKRKNKKIGILLSGGLDSLALTGHYLDRGYLVWPVYVKCRLPWERAELAHLKKFLKKIARRKLHPLQTVEFNLARAYDRNWSRTGRTPNAQSSDKAVFLPARNLLLIVSAVLQLSHLNIRHLALGPLKGNPFPDGKPNYFRRLEKILSESLTAPIRISTPFRNLTKSEVIRRYHHWPLDLSFSCLNPKELQPCETCNKCAELSKALRASELVGSRARIARSV